MSARTRGAVIVLAILAALALVAAMVWYVMQLSESDSGDTGIETLPGHEVIAVKIDNVAAARPQTGLGKAETVYVEPVEGGLTRLLAIYGGELPEAIGPIRSARASDIELLAQYGRPTFVYSGAAAPVLTDLAAAPLVRASPSRTAGFYRNTEHETPHDLFVDPAALPEPEAPPAVAPLQRGTAPAGGTVTAHHTTRYDAATFDFDWLARQGWRVSLDGSPVMTTEGDTITPRTVVVQQVEVTSTGPPDALGNRAPTVSTVGSGTATVLRNGGRFDARWFRPSPEAPTRFRTVDGTPLPMDLGQVWILLVPDE